MCLGGGMFLALKSSAQKRMLKSYTDRNNLGHITFIVDSDDEVTACIISSTKQKKVSVILIFFFLLLCYCRFFFRIVYFLSFFPEDCNNHMYIFTSILISAILFHLSQQNFSVR